jgi:D-alanyl-D-alanine carboxypeptidase
MKKFLTLLLSSILIFSNINYTAKAKASPPAVSADSVVLMDAATGTILYSKNMNAAYPPASTTKVMTALLTLEKAKLDEMATVSPKVPFVDGSKIGLFEGEKLPVKELLYGLMLMSGNDCAETLAEHVSGSIGEFAKLMTKRAKELGCENTNFVNPSGLYDSSHKTSAKDLALIMREAMTHPEFREFVSTTIYQIPPTNLHPEGIHLANENKLLYKNSKYYYSAAEGGKTGYTIQSRFSYVASASKNGHRLIAAFVHDENKSYYDDAKVLFEYGFNNFELAKLCSKGDKIASFNVDDTEIPLLSEEDYFYIKEKSSTEEAIYSLLPVSLENKYFKKGDCIAEASVKLDDKVLPNIKLTSAVDHEEKTVFGLSTDSTKKSGNIFLRILKYIFIFLILAVVVLRTRKVIRMRMRRKRR